MRCRHDDYRRDDRGRDSDRYHDDRREPYDDRRERFDDRRERFDDRRERYDDRREPFDDRRDRYDDRRDRFDDRRDRFEDRRMPRDPPPRVGKRPLDTRGSTSLFIGVFVSMILNFNILEESLQLTCVAPKSSKSMHRFCIDWTWPVNFSQPNQRMKLEMHYFFASITKKALTQL